ncbi:MAG: PTS fructose transporter subunit IIB, partial [Mycoplasma sp.]|nr:PTS fructose transporter subunit IIB [Mycoplasma sp.]
LMKSIGNEDNPILKAMLKIGESSFTLMIPILASYIAYSIAGKSALAPSMVVTFLANNKNFFYHYKFIENLQFQPLGFVGAILIGYLIGFSIKQLNKLKLPEPLLPIIPLFITPILIGGSFAIFVIFLLGPLLGILMHYLQEGLTQLYSNNSEVKVITFFISLVIGAMAGFDMGGPVNKMAFLTCSLMISQGIKQPMGAMAAAIPVAPLGMGLTTLIFKSKFDIESKNLGISSLVSGFIGISEGAIPFALKDPKKVIIANVVGSSIAAGVASLFNVNNNAAHGGPIMALVGAVPYGMQTIYFLIAILIGTIITSGLYGWMLSRSKKSLI